MKYLFFLISFLYSFGFYLFYVLFQNKNIFLQDLEEKKNILNISLFDSQVLSSNDILVVQSFFWDLRLEALFFLMVGIFFFFYFSNSDAPIKKQTQKHSVINKENISYVFKKISYFIGFILFYTSLYFITKWLWFEDFSGLILLFHILILVFFFVSKYSKISLDFLRVNSILFSLTYIFSYCYIFITHQNTFWFIDGINSFFIVVTFLILLYFDKKISQKKIFDIGLITHLSVYLFFVFLFYLYFFFVDQNIFYWTVFICTLFGFLWFEVLPKIKLFSHQVVLLRYIWILFSYIWILLWILFLLFEKSILIFFLLLLQALYHFFIHQKYSNIISYGISLLLGSFVLFYSIFVFFSIELWNIYVLLFWAFLSFFLVWISYFLSYKTPFDIYVLHIFAHIINIVFVSLCVYFFHKNFDVLYIWLLLWAESLYFFTSYYKLQVKK